MNEKVKKVFEKCCDITCEKLLGDNGEYSDVIVSINVTKLKEYKELDFIDINEIYDGIQEAFKNELYKNFKEDGLIS